jgi:zinc protease
MTSRFIPPSAGDPVAVRFPSIQKAVLDSGLDVWAIPYAALPVVTIVIVVPFGSRHDPADQPGLAGVTADLFDEGAGDRDAIGLAEAFAALGTEVSVDISADVTTLSLTVLSRCFEPAMDLLFDIVARPRFDDADFLRVVEMRLNRLRQLRSSASAIADRVLLRGVFGDHPYGHSTMGTTAALEAFTIDDVRAFHARAVTPAGATCIVAGAVEATVVHDVVARLGRRWAAPAMPRLTGPAVMIPQAPRVWLVDRPGSPQTEVRVGHQAPSRHVAAYHALVTLNAVLGGQFTSRINLNLREARGLTYGAHTGFDFRVEGGAFSCDTAVQADATLLAVREILSEFEAVGASRPADGAELARAKSSLTRGYVRHFETPAHLAHAAARLATFGLPEDTFARYVPAVEAVTATDVSSAAAQYVRPQDASVVLVGDATAWRESLTELGRPVTEIDDIEGIHEA